MHTARNAGRIRSPRETNFPFAFRALFADEILGASAGNIVVTSLSREIKYFSLGHNYVPRKTRAVQTTKYGSCSETVRFDDQAPAVEILLQL